MLKAYAVAVVLATATPVALKSEQGTEAPAKNKAEVIKTETSKNGLKKGDF